MAMLEDYVVPSVKLKPNTSKEKEDEMFLQGSSDVLEGKSGKEIIKKTHNFSKISTLCFFSIIIFPTLIDFSINPVCSNAAGGSGTESDPYIIETCHEIQAIQDELDAYYVLGGDVDCSGTLYWNWGEGFLPIGSSMDPFDGQFDGQGYKITKLNINRPGLWGVGLFAYIGSGSTIKNLGLIHVNITGKNVTGGLLGGNHSGTVANSYSTGRVNCTMNTVGGLVGVNNGLVSHSYSVANVSSDSRCAGGLVGENRGTIIKSYAKGDVSNDSDDVGGLVGSNISGEILKCYATGNVSGNNATVGGLVGRNAYTRAFISDCYATGNVSAGSGAYVRAGGLVGLNGGTGWGDEAISNCYSTGNVSASAINNVGGLVGANSNSEQTINNSFWDVETSGQFTSDGGTGKKTVQMKTKSTFTDAGWDFHNTWDIDTFINNGYPFIQEDVIPSGSIIFPIRSRDGKTFIIKL